MFEESLAFVVQEEERLSSALQTEEFRDMLLDYMKEISDPATRAEREAYIEQMGASCRT
jgi:hypothetical protein